MVSKEIGNTYSRQSFESLADAFQGVLDSGDADTKTLLVGRKTKDKCEIDGVARNDITYLSQKSKKHGPSAVIYKLSGRRKADYEEARRFLDELVSQARRSGLKGQKNAVDNIESVLLNSRPKGRIELTADNKRNLQEIINGVRDMRTQDSAQAVRSDLRGVDERLMHFLDGIQGQPVSKFAPANAPSPENQELLKDISHINSQAASLKNSLPRDAADKLRLKRKSFTWTDNSRKSKADDEAIGSLLDKMAHWPGPDLQSQLKFLFQNTAEGDHGEVFKQASKSILLALAEQESTLKLTHDVLTSDAFLDAAEDQREALLAMASTSQALLSTFNDPTAPFARLKNLALAGYHWPVETAQQVAAMRVEFFKSVIGAAPSDVLPPPQHFLQPPPDYPPPPLSVSHVNSPVPGSLPIIASAVASSLNGIGPPPDSPPPPSTGNPAPGHGTVARLIAQFSSKSPVSNEQEPPPDDLPTIANVTPPPGGPPGSSATDSLAPANIPLPLDPVQAPSSIANSTQVPPPDDLSVPPLDVPQADMTSSPVTPASQIFEDFSSRISAQIITDKIEANNPDSAVNLLMALQFEDQSMTFSKMNDDNKGHKVVTKGGKVLYLRASKEKEGALGFIVKNGPLGRRFAQYDKTRIAIEALLEDAEGRGVIKSGWGEDDRDEDGVTIKQVLADKKRVHFKDVRAQVLSILSKDIAKKADALGLAPLDEAASSSGTPFVDADGPPDDLPPPPVDPFNGGLPPPDDMPPPRGGNWNGGVPPPVDMPPPAH